MELGEFVKQERQRRGLTQKQLADKANVGLNFVYQLENNKQTVQLDKTNQVLRTLGYTVGAVRHFEPWVDDRESKITPREGAISIAGGFE